MATDVHPRRFWSLLEPIHAVSYFAPECEQAFEAAGYRGFWMGYFAGRAAPLGPAPAALVEATFANFAPRMVQRSVPDAWSFAAPAVAIEARASGAAAALRRLVPEVEARAAAVIAPLEAVVARIDTDGRPLAAVNRALAPRSDPVERLWQAATTLREHRGDGHVAALCAAGVSGLEGHVIAAAAGRSDAAWLQRARGWTDDEWAAAVDRLRSRGLLHGEPAALTADGVELLAGTDASTDAGAGRPFAAALPAGDRVALAGALRPITAAVLAAGLIAPGNPIGLDVRPEAAR